MKLGNIRAYVQQHGVVSLTAVAVHFNLSEAAALHALEFWIEQGKVIKANAACGSSCGGCADKNQQFQWVGEQTIKWPSMT